MRARCISVNGRNFYVGPSHRPRELAIYLFKILTKNHKQCNSISISKPYDVAKVSVWSKTRIEIELSK